MVNPLSVPEIIPVKIFDPLLYFLAQFEQLLLATPWPLFLAVAGVLAWMGSKSYKVTIGVMLAFFAIGYFGMWTPMISTVTMITAATLLCLTLGIPLGIWMSRSDRIQSLITPVLDIMQTIPSFVYLIPVVMLLGIGKVPGLIAVCIYAMPPIVRLTNLGIRQVSKGFREATYHVAGVELNIAIVQDGSTIQEFFQRMKKTKKEYHFVEFIAASGQFGIGGGQPIHPAITQDNVPVQDIREKALMSLDLLENQAVGIGDHTANDFLKDATESLQLLAEAEDRLEMIKKYFDNE